MLFNLILHIAAGVFGSSIFSWTGSGIFWAAIIAAMSQAVEIVRMYFYHKRLILARPDHIREEQMKIFRHGALYKFSQLYVAKVVWYGLVVLVAAQIARPFSA